MKSRRDYSFKEKKNHYIKVAQELGYSDSVISEIEKATTESQISTILCKARKADCGDDVIFGRRLMGSYRFVNDDRKFR